MDSELKTTIAFWMALIALVISSVGSLSNAHAQKHNSNARDKIAINNCRDNELLKLVTRRALESAIVRARSSQENPAIRQAAIEELRAEIKLLTPRECEV